MTWRGLALFWAVLQFALPGAALVADARLESRALETAGSHVEAGSSEDCPPVHRDECALCQVVSRFAQPVDAPALPAIADVVRPSAESPVETQAACAAATASLPRAPPPVV